MEDHMPDLRYARGWLDRARDDLFAMRDYFNERGEGAYADRCEVHAATLGDIVARANIVPSDPANQAGVTLEAGADRALARAEAGISRGLVIELMREHWQDPAGFHEAVAESLGIDESEYEPPRAWRYELDREVVDAAARLWGYFESRGPTMASSSDVVTRDRDTQLIARAIAQSEGEAVREPATRPWNGRTFASDAQRAAWAKYEGIVDPASAEVHEDGTIVARRIKDRADLCVFVPDGSRVKFEGAGAMAVAARSRTARASGSDERRD